MLTRLATVSLLAVLSLSPPASQNPADDVAALRREIQALKEEQARMQQELQAIKKFLQSVMQPRGQADSGPDMPGLVGALVPTEGEPVMGAANAAVTVMEISDYHCPFCRRHTQQTFPQINTEFVKTGKVRYMFVDYPIAQLHPQAARSHEAAACAGDQGKYWEMHISIFNNTPARDDGALVAQAKNLGLDAGRFTACLTEGRHTKAVEASVSRIERLGIQGTPMTVIGITPAPGQPLKIVKYVYGARPYADFKAAIESVLTGK